MDDHTTLITSHQNPKVKLLRSLHKNSIRKAERLILVEGFKEVSYALSAHLRPHSLYVCPDISKEDSFSALNPLLLSRELYARVAYRESTDGVIGIFHEPDSSLETLPLSRNPLLLVVEAVEKPGNLGAIVRTADGAGADAVIVCDPRCDVWNPNAIRASVGTIFSKPVIATTNESLHSYLEQHGITAYAARLTPEARQYTSADFISPTALVLGTEHEGLSLFWHTRAQAIMIPMQGMNDSLNVSNAAAILAYEVVRQRNDH